MDRNLKALTCLPERPIPGSHLAIGIHAQPGVTLCYLVRAPEEVPAKGTGWTSSSIPCRRRSAAAAQTTRTRLHRPSMNLRRGRPSMATVNRSATSDSASKGP